MYVPAPHFLLIFVVYCNFEYVFFLLSVECAKRIRKENVGNASSVAYELYRNQFQMLIIVSIAIDFPIVMSPNATNISLH